MEEQPQGAKPGADAVAQAAPQEEEVLGGELSAPAADLHEGSGGKSIGRMSRRAGAVVVVAAYWFVSAGTLGMQYAFGAVYPDLLEELGGGRAQTALIGSLCTGVMDLSAILSGALLARFGERAVCAAGGILSGLGLLFSTLGSRVEHLYFPYGFMMGFGHSMSLYAGVVATNKRFTAGRGLAQALGNTGASVGPLVLGSLYHRLSEALGWRNALRTVAACDMLVLCVGAVAFREAQPASEQGTVAKARSQSFLGLLRNARLVQLCGANLFFALGGWSVFPSHLVRLALDAGLGPAEASQLLVLLGLGTLFVRVPVCVLADRWGRRLVFGACLVVYAAVLLLMAFWPDLRELLPYCAALVGGLIGSLLSLMAALPPEAVEAQDLALATTLACSFFGLGALGGPVITGAMFDAGLGYGSALIVASGSLLVSAALLAVPVGKFARQEKPPATAPANSGTAGSDVGGSSACAAAAAAAEPHAEMDSTKEVAL